MWIVLDKTKVMTNNQMASTIGQYKDSEVRTLGEYLGSVTNDPNLKCSEILSRSAQTTTATSGLKIIMESQGIMLASKVKLMHTLILSTFLLCQ